MKSQVLPTFSQWNDTIVFVNAGKFMVEQEFLAEDSNLEKALAFVTQNLEEAECSPKIMMQIEISLEEIFVNIAHYAYKNTPEKQGKVRIAFSLEDETARITVCDSGIPYNPLEKEDPDITLSAEERPIGGLGIFMVKKYMDEIRYEHADGENRLVLIKKLA